MILGISGKIGAGKDVIASYLVRRHGFTILRMSDALKEEVLTRFPRTLDAAKSYLAHQGLVGMHLALRELVYDVKPPIIRELLQEHGTEVRRHDDPDYWTTRWTGAARRLLDAGHSIVCPDIRFPNEMAAVRALGGSVVRVHRPGFPTGDHPSEIALDWIKAWDGYFDNETDVPALEAKVTAWLRLFTPRACSRGVNV